MLDSQLYKEDDGSGRGGGREGGKGEGKRRGGALGNWGKEADGSTQAHAERAPGLLIAACMVLPNRHY